MITTAKPGNIFEEIVKRGHDEDFIAFAGAGFRPTDAPPGSQEKIDVLRRRVELGQPLWHENDRVDYKGLTNFVRSRYAEESREKLANDESAPAQLEEASEVVGDNTLQSRFGGVSLPRQDQQSMEPGRSANVLVDLNPKPSPQDTLGQGRSSSATNIASQSMGRNPTQQEQRLIRACKDAFEAGTITQSDYLSGMRDLMGEGINVSDSHPELNPGEVA